MKGRLLKFLSAAAMIPVIASSVFFAKNVMAAEQTYNGTIKDYTYDEKYNTGKYFEPVKDGKYQAIIYFHGASEPLNSCDLGNLPERLKNDLNKWIDAGYCDPKVVITPQITNYKSTWGITDFKEYFTGGYFETLLNDVKSGAFSEKIDTSKPILVAGYSQGGSAALFAAARHKTDLYNVGAFSPSWCFYHEDLKGNPDGWVESRAGVAFSKRTDGSFFMSYGAEEDPPSYVFKENCDRYIKITEENGQNISGRFKSRVYSGDFGKHGWKIFELGTFDFLYYNTFGSVAPEETTVNACWGTVTISGTEEIGNTLTASCRGYYTSAFKYQWYRVNASTGKATAIDGATSESYTLTSADKDYKIRCRVTDKNGGTGYSYRTTGIISPSQTKPALSGTVNVSGHYRYGQPLTARTVNCPASNLSYQWKRGDENISGAVFPTYTLTKDDIKKYVTCEITDNDGNYSGSIKSTKIMVQKGFGPAQPAVTAVDCSAKGVSDGKILNVSTKMEYAKGSQDGPYQDCTGTEITGLSKGTYFVRIKETAYEDTGAMTMVSIKEKEDGPTPTDTVTPTPTDTVTPTPTEAEKAEPTDTVTPTPASVTEQPSVTPAGPTATAVPSATQAPLASPSAAPSATVSAAPSATVSVTPAEAEVKLEAVKISKIENGTKGIDLKWTAAVGAESVNVLRSSDGKKFSLIKTLAASAVSYTDKKVKNGSIYYYKIEAVNGKLWSRSEVAQICRLGRVKVIKKSGKAKSAYLKWKKNPKASGYQIRYTLKGKTKILNVKKAKNVTKTVKKLKSKKKYSFAVRAYKKAGKIKYYGAWSKTYKLKIK